MKLYSFLLLFVLATPACLYAQQSRHSDYDASSLSVFSESGETFFLVINGVSQNIRPKSKVRVEGLEQYDNDIEIIFADNKTHEIRKKVSIADPMDGNPVHMTLRIVRNSNGYPKLMFYSSAVAGEDNNTQSGGNVTASIQPAPSDNSNNDGAAASTAAMTAPAPPPSVPDEQQVFSDTKKIIANSSKESARFATAQTILTSKSLTTNQVIEICKLFAFDNTRLAYAKLAYSKVTDPGNYSAVGNTIALSANKQRLNDFMDSNKR